MTTLINTTDGVFLRSRLAPSRDPENGGEPVNTRDVPTVLDIYTLHTTHTHTHTHIVEGVSGF